MSVGTEGGQNLWWKGAMLHDFIGESGAAGPMIEQAMQAAGENDPPPQVARTKLATPKRPARRDFGSGPPV